jgi:hypothetical protein
MDFEMPQRCILINGRKYQVYPYFLVTNSMYFENFFDEIACDVDIILPFKMDKNEETYLLNFFQIASHIEMITLYYENVSYYYELAVYFGFTDIIEYCQRELIDNSKLNFKKELQNNRIVVDVHLKMFYFNIDYTFLKTLYKYNKNLLCNYLNSDMLKINEQYIDIFKQSSKNKELHLHKLLKNNIRNNKKYYDLFLLNVYDHISPHLIKPFCEFENKFNEITFGVLQKLSWNNIIIAGGASIICLLERDIPYNEYSDIDIWIYGETNLERTIKHEEILKYFESMFGDSLYFSINKCVITIIICGIKRNFQIILTNHKHKYQIIQRFDMDYVKCLYDGVNVYGTVDFIEAINSNYASFCENDEMMKYNKKDFRLFKAWQKGFAINKKYDLDSEMKIELKYYYIDEKNTFDIDNIINIFKPQMVKSLTYQFLNDKYIENNLEKNVKQTYADGTLDDYFTIVTTTNMQSNTNIQINDVLFFTYSKNIDNVEKKHNNVDIEYKTKYCLIDEDDIDLHVNINHINNTILKKLKKNSNIPRLSDNDAYRICDSSLYHTHPIDGYCKQSDSPYVTIDSDVRKEFQYFFSQINQFETFSMDISKNTIITDIFGNKLNKIPRMSMATVIVSLNETNTKIKELNVKKCLEFTDTFYVCEKIIVYPPNYYTNMKF